MKPRKKSVTQWSSSLSSSSVLHRKKSSSESTSQSEEFLFDPPPPVEGETPASDELVRKVKRELKVVASSNSVASHVEDVTLNKLDLDGSRLFGRQAELRRLNRALETRILRKRKPQGKDSVEEQDPEPRTEDSSEVRMLLISGASGTGKSKLAQGLRKKVLSQGGFFCTGKFDLQQRVEPYTAFASACSELTSQVMARDDKKGFSVQARIQTEMGDNCDLLVQALPSLNCFLPSPESENESTHSSPPKVETQTNRLQYMASKFFRTLDEQPLVIVLDDLQWADPASLNLATTLLEDTENQSILLIGTYRSDEMKSNCHLVDKIKLWHEDASLRVEHIHLQDLDQEAVQALVTSALHSSDDISKPLADLVHHKTHGNAFFVEQFLKSLVDQDLLTYSFGGMCWLWKEEEIRSLPVTANVADLMASKLSNLPCSTLLTLQVAACLGQSFDLVILASVMESVRQKKVFVDESFSGNFDIHHALEQPLSDGLLEQIEPGIYAFSHDQIQNAAQSLMPPETLSLLRLQIGERLMKDSDDSEGGQGHFFMAVDLCNLASPRIGTAARVDAARYNLLAGEGAMKKAAFSPAFKYFESGLAFLGKDAWTRNYGLSLDLSCGAVEAGYCSGDFVGMEKHEKGVLSSNGPFDDKVRVYLTKILALGVRERFKEAVDTGRLVLKKMGITDLPRDPSDLTVLREAKKTKVLFKNQTKQTLMQLPIATDGRWILAVGVVDRMASKAYLFNMNFYIVMHLRCLRWTLKHGVSKFSPSTFATYGIILGNRFADAEGAKLFGKKFYFVAMIASLCSC